MIQRSQRGKQPRATEARPISLTLHERIASQRLWFLRLMTASTVALALSFVLWLVRVPLEYHLGGIAVGFIAGLFARRPMQSWALAWIRERAGLSYETALEQRTRQDDFGFSETLQQRATQEVSRLAPPKYQVWWLPMLAVALGLAFLPLIPSVANLPSPFNIPAPTTTTTTNEPNPSEPNQPTATQAANEPNETNSSASPSESTGETNASELNNPTGSSNTSASQNNQSADEEALGRFLDNLKENEPPSSDSPDADLSSVMPQSQGGQSDEDNASRPRSTQTNPFARPGEQQEGQPNANQNSEQGQGNEQGQQDQGQQGQEQGQEQQQAQSENGQGKEQGSGEEQAQQNADEQGGGQQGTGAEGEQNQQGSGQSASAEGEGNEQNNDTGQNAEGAGSLAGTPTGQGEEVMGDSQQNPEFLQGRVDEGLNNTAGTVRLPGETSQTVFPEGSSPGSFSRAEEEALTEGRIPLEYQEVIRNYFRTTPQ